MSALGWQQLIPPASFDRGAGRYPIDAYSEFMPPPRLGWKAYDAEPPDPQLFDPADPWGWYISEYEEANELRPGIEQLARQLVGRVCHTLRGEPAHSISRRLLDDNAYWSKELTEYAGKLKHERCVFLENLRSGYANRNRAIFQIRLRRSARSPVKSLHSACAWLSCQSESSSP